MPKITPLKERFESVEAILGRILEDAPAIAGFVMMVAFKDGTVRPVQINATCEQAAFAAAYWLRVAASVFDEEEATVIR